MLMCVCVCVCNVVLYCCNCCIVVFAWKLKWLLAVSLWRCFCYFHLSCIVVVANYVDFHNSRIVCLQSYTYMHTHMYGHMYLHMYMYVCIFVTNMRKLFVILSLKLKHFYFELYVLVKKVATSITFFSSSCLINADVKRIRECEMSLQSFQYHSLFLFWNWSYPHDKSSSGVWVLNQASSSRRNSCDLCVTNGMKER